MIQRLIEMYESGSITGYQLMMDCLEMLDPSKPELVLAELPGEILDEILDYAHRYNPRLPRSETLLPPAHDQVRAAERWICAHSIATSKLK